MHKIIIFFIIMMFSHSIYAAGVGTNDKYDESINSDLKLLYSSKITKNLRKSMDLYVSQKIKISPTMNNLKDDYLELFKEKFVMLKIKQGDLGGYFVTIMISQKKILALKLWVYAVDNDEYEIRYIKQMPLSKEREIELENIAKDENNLGYWQ
jgi:hypothetical protein